MSNQKIINIKSLSISYVTEQSETKALKNISFSLFKDETLGIVGESGSGKSTIAHAILKLLPTSAQITSGEINFNNQDLVKVSENEMQKIRGKEISMIFQDPFTSLNPVLTIGEQIAEVIRFHEKVNIKIANDKVFNLLNMVGINNPETRINDFPHQFSGGMRQRVMIAMALASSPSVLIADEPTTALDVTIQAQILDLIKEIEKKMGLTTIYITHNLGIVAQMCTNVIVVEKGIIVEEGKTRDILEKPKHPYTKKLVNSLKYFM